ncbi:MULTISPECIES: pentapeptide repeat-containing protein [Parafrankia]|uniref:pentapeptide repeat-containing protein n=1 Tax=Parafrankia TaxID=2994362 RepID=UPI000B87F9DD|nr:pentapeptide repeat-containing protein [Parafrankia sp. CH37]
MSSARTCGGESTWTCIARQRATRTAVLSGAALSGAALSGAALSGAVLSGAVLSGALLRGPAPVMRSRLPGQLRRGPGDSRGARRGHGRSSPWCPSGCPRTG